MYKLILMDFHMPINNGAETTKVIIDYLESVTPKNRICTGRPYIVCTNNYINSSIKAECLESGVDSFAIKPIFKKGIYSILI